MADIANMIKAGARHPSRATACPDDVQRPLFDVDLRNGEHGDRAVRTEITVQDGERLTALTPSGAGRSNQGRSGISSTEHHPITPPVGGRRTLYRRVHDQRCTGAA